MTKLVVYEPNRAEPVEIEYRTKDKTSWGPGPWTSEPDKVQFTVGGMAALVVRNQFGALCGYVGVPREHPWFGLNYSDCTLPTATEKNWRKIKAEGKHFIAGMSLMKHSRKPEQSPLFKGYYQRHRHRKGCGEDYCAHSVERLLNAHGGITFAGPCHEGNEEDTICHIGAPVWWFGFDTAHWDDYIPGMPLGVGRHGTYRDMAYVRTEIASLAEQLTNAC